MEKKIKVILKEIRTKENGPASEAMTNLGLKYTKNHGVKISDLKEIAAKYSGDSELAKELRNIDVRETKLLGIMIEDPTEIHIEEIQKIVNNITNIELAEQTCIQLLTKTENYIDNAFKWVRSKRLYPKVTGYILFSEIAKKNDRTDNDVFIKLIEYAPNDFEHEHYHVRISLAKALRNIALRNKELKTVVLENVETIKQNKNPLSKIIYEETAGLLKYSE